MRVFADDLRARYWARYDFAMPKKKHFSKPFVARIINSSNIPPMLVGYARVSTQEQNLAMQIEALVEYGVDRKRIWEEKRSATAKTRPKLDQCLEFMVPGDTLVVWRMDRLARSVSQLIQLLETFKEREINFVSLHDHIETVTPQGKLLFHISAAFAQFERDLTSYRTTEGLKRKMADGWKPGPKRILTPSEEDQVFAWKETDMTAKAIAKRVKNEFGKTVSERTVKLTYDRVQKRNER